MRREKKNKMNSKLSLNQVIYAPRFVFQKILLKLLSNCRREKWCGRRKGLNMFFTFDHKKTSDESLTERPNWIFFLIFVSIFNFTWFLQDFIEFEDGIVTSNLMYIYCFVCGWFSIHSLFIPVCRPAVKTHTSRCWIHVLKLSFTRKKSLQSNPTWSFCSSFMSHMFMMMKLLEDDDDG